MLCRREALLWGMILLAGWPAGRLWAAEVTLMWDPNSETNLTGYRLYRANKSLINASPAQAYSDAAVVKTDVPAASNSITVTELEYDQYYYFRLTARNADEESDFNVDSAGNPGQVLVYLRRDDDQVRAGEKFLTPGVADGINDEARFGAKAKEVVVINARGRVVARISRDGSGSSLTWNCRDDSGKVLPSGLYTAKIITDDNKRVYQTFLIAK